MKKLLLLFLFAHSIAEDGLVSRPVSVGKCGEALDKGSSSEFAYHYNYPVRYHNGEVQFLLKGSVINKARFEGQATSKNVDTWNNPWAHSKYGRFWVYQAAPCIFWGEHKVKLKKAGEKKPVSIQHFFPEQYKIRFFLLNKDVDEKSFIEKYKSVFPFHELPTWFTREQIIKGDYCKGKSFSKSQQKCFDESLKVYLEKNPDLLKVLEKELKEQG